MQRTPEAPTPSTLEPLMVVRPATRRVATLAAMAAATSMAVLGASGPAAAADPPPPVYAFGANIQLGGQDVVPPTPTAGVAAAPGDQSKTLIDIPASPLAV